MKLRNDRLRSCDGRKVDATLVKAFARCERLEARGARARLVFLQGEMKIIGRRRGWKGGVEAADGFLQLMVALREGRRMIPRGVHRFRSHEEADAWTLKMLCR